MSSSSSSSEADERRLRPLYSLLDSGSNKATVQQADKILKKFPHLDAARALKSLALYRMGKHGECEAIIAQLAASEPTDEGTLNVMSICYKELQNEAGIISLYERAARKCPSSEELLSRLFMAHVRVSDYKKQQQVAMQIYKLTPNKPYFLWAIMSLLLQAKADPKLGATMYLPLARRMLEKMKSESRMTSCEETLLYLTVLEFQADFAAALNFIRSPTANVIVHSLEMNMLERKELVLLEQLGEWKSLQDKCYELIVKSPEEWSFYEKLIKATKETGDSEMVVQFLKEQSSHSMCPLLAQLYLKPGNLNLFSVLFSKFSEKPCFFAMLEEHLNGFSDCDSLLKIINDDLSSCLITNGAKPNTTNLIYKQLNALQISRYLGHSEPTAFLLDSFQHCSQVSKDLKQSEVQPAENYLLLAIHGLLDEYIATRDQSIIWRCIHLLEDVANPSVQALITLMRLYIFLGVTEAATTLYDRLEIKQLLQDTLGFTLINYLQHFGSFFSTRLLHDTVLQFFIHNTREISDHIINCYKNGSFTKIPEILELRESLNHSLTFVKLSTEKVLLDLLTQSKAEKTVSDHHELYDMCPEKDEPDWAILEDHRDLSILYSWQRKANNRQTDSFKLEKVWTRVCNITIRSLVASIQATKETSALDVVRTLKDDFIDALRDLEETDVSDLFAHPLGCPLVPIQCYRAINGGATMLAALKLVLASLETAEEEIGVLEACLKDGAQALGHTSAITANNGGFVVSPDELIKIELWLETVGCVLVILDVCHKTHIIKTLPRQVFISTCQAITSLLTGVSGILENTEACLLSEGMGSLKVEECQETSERIRTWVISSYRSNISQLRDYIKTKLKYVESLTF